MDGMTTSLDDYALTLRGSGARSGAELCHNHQAPTHLHGNNAQTTMEHQRHAGHRKRLPDISTWKMETLPHRGSSSNHPVGIKIFGATPVDLPPELGPTLQSYHAVPQVDFEGEAPSPGFVNLSVNFAMESKEDLQANRKAFERNFIASIGTDKTMPWCRFDTDVTLPGAVIKVRNQGTSVDVIRETPRPVIESIFPAAVCSGEVTLVVSGLATDAGLEVMCRFKGKYRDLLDVTRVELRPDEKAFVSVLIPPHMRQEDNPNFNLFGAAWLEVVEDTAKGVRSSLPRTILVTYSKEIMQEVAPLHRLLPEEMTASDVDSLIQDLGAVMHPDENDVPPPLRCFASVAATAAKLGLTETMSAAVCNSKNHTATEVLEAADCGSPGRLLSQAVLSGNGQTMEELVELYRDQMLPVPLNEPNPESGMTALHCAGLMNGEKEMLRFFSCRCPDEFAAGFNVIASARPGEASPRDVLVNNRGTSMASKIQQPPAAAAAAIAAAADAAGISFRACEGLDFQAASILKAAVVSTMASVCVLVFSCVMSSVLTVFWAKVLLMAATVLNSACAWKTLRSTVRGDTSSTVRGGTSSMVRGDTERGLDSRGIRSAARASGPSPASYR